MGSPFELAESENLQELSRHTAGNAEILRQIISPQLGDGWGGPHSWPAHGEKVQQGSNEGDREREEWGPFM